MKDDSLIELQRVSILKCVQLALQEYPLSPEEKKLIVLEIHTDFEFYGSEIVMKHILFNLLKNALYQIKSVGKGSIKIWTDPNVLYFEDTASGIPKKHLQHIFDQFFTRTAFGSGIGLAFCKMVMRKIGGEITCDSVLGEFTRFTLSFPIIHERSF